MIAQPEWLLDPNRANELNDWTFIDLVLLVRVPRLCPWSKDQLRTANEQV